MTSQLILNERHLSFRALPWADAHPALDWFEALLPRTRGHFRALTRLMDKAYEIGFAYPGRVVPVQESVPGLVRLRVTPPGEPDPQVAYARLCGSRVLIACAGRDTQELRRHAVEIVL